MPRSRSAFCFSVRKSCACGAARAAHHPPSLGGRLRVGLLHGFGFASALTSAGLPRAELPLALLSFNIGVEIGQLGFVVLVLLLERAFRILDVRWPRWVQVLPGLYAFNLPAAARLRSVEGAM